MKMAKKEKFTVKEGTDMSFIGLLDNGPRIKILSHLILGCSFENGYSMNDIAKACELSKDATVKPQLCRMLKQGLVTRVRGGQGGNRISYKINQDSPHVKIFIRCFNAILKAPRGY